MKNGRMAIKAIVNFQPRAKAIPTPANSIVNENIIPAAFSPVATWIAKDSLLIFDANDWGSLSSNHEISCLKTDVKYLILNIVPVYSETIPKNAK